MQTALWCFSSVTLCMGYFVFLRSFPSVQIEKSDISPLSSTVTPWRRRKVEARLLLKNPVSSSALGRELWFETKFKKNFTNCNLWQLRSRSQSSWNSRKDDELEGKCMPLQLTHRFLVFISHQRTHSNSKPSPPFDDARVRVVIYCWRKSILCLHTRCLERERERGVKKKK